MMSNAAVINLKLLKAVVMDNSNWALSNFVVHDNGNWTKLMILKLSKAIVIDSGI